MIPSWSMVTPNLESRGDLAIQSALQGQGAPVLVRGGPQAPHRLFVHDCRVSILILHNQEGKMMLGANAIRCLFPRVLLQALLHCPTTEMVGRLKAPLLPFQNGRREDFWEEELLGKFSLDSTVKEGKCVL